MLPPALVFMDFQTSSAPPSKHQKIYTDSVDSSKKK